MLTTLGKVLRQSQCEEGAWLFLPANDPWKLNSSAYAGKKNEVAPEGEDKDKAGYPDIVISNNMMEALDMATVQSIVENAQSQILNVTDQELYEAFLYYYDNDAYIKWNNAEPAI